MKPKTDIKGKEITVGSYVKFQIPDRPYPTYGSISRFKGSKAFVLIGSTSEALSEYEVEVNELTRIGK